jgi:hypothetical protein
MTRLALRWLSAIALAPLAASLPAQEAENLAEGLVTLRSNVEQLNSELELAREEARTTLAGLAAQKAELQAQLDRQDLATREQAQKLEQARLAVEQAGVAGADLQPTLLTAIAAIRNHVESTLPFKQDERLAALDQLRERIDTGQVPPHRAANQVWAFIEDELRLTRENGVFSQTIELDGERVLADVAKVGNVLLYFRTSDGRMGRLVQDGASWRYAEVGDSADSARIAALFDAYRKQIRQGWFELPLAAAGTGAGQ